MRYGWYGKVSPPWRQVAYRIVRDIGAERFIGNTELIESIAFQDLDRLLDAIEHLPVSNPAIELIEALNGRE